MRSLVPTQYPEMCILHPHRIRLSANTSPFMRRYITTRGNLQIKIPDLPTTQEMTTIKGEKESDHNLDAYHNLGIDADMKLHALKETSRTEARLHLTLGRQGL
jgi:uncharacterized protein YxeA